MNPHHRHSLIASAKILPMTTPQRTSQPGTFFVTTACYQRRRLFQVDRNAQLFLETLQHYRAHFHLHAFVVMPDHAHLLITPHAMITIERAMQYVKGGFSHRLESKMPGWQKGFADHYGFASLLIERVRPTKGIALPGSWAGEVFAPVPSPAASESHHSD